VRETFLLDPGVAFLNHGSFGACPEPVFAEYQRLQRELERRPVEFLGRRFESLLHDARAALAAFVGARVDDLVLVENATAGVNALARSLRLDRGDEVLATDHEYGGLVKTWNHVCARAGAQFVQHPVDLTDPVESLWSAVTERTRVLYVSHIASATAVRFPVEELCRRAREAGILAVVDGAHVPGQIPLDLASLGADVYTGNCHTWLCAPKGAGFLWARPEHQQWLDPLVISWGYDDDSSFAERHGWQGTRDPAAYLAVPAAIEFQRANDWDRVRERCHALLADALDALGREPLAGDFVQMAAFELPPCDVEDVQRRLREEHAIEVPCWEWNGRPLLRISVQGYNTREDLERLVAALREVLAS
jgi:isopenicillin-N epimerase